MKRLLCFILVCFLLLLFPGAVSNAESTDLRVEISPQDCTFESINDGTNEVRYVTPENCTSIIPAPPVPKVQTYSPPQTPSNNQSTGLPSYSFFGHQQNNHTENANNDPYLNDFSEYLASKGKEPEINLSLSLGQKAYFSLEAELHSVTVKEIKPNYVIITIASTPTDVKLFVGDIRKLDIKRDGKSDIEVTLNRITNGSADITLRRLQNNNQAGGKLVQQYSPEYKYFGWILTATVAVAGVSTLFIFKKIKRRRNPN